MGPDYDSPAHDQLHHHHHHSTPTTALALALLPLLSSPVVLATAIVCALSSLFYIARAHTRIPVAVSLWLNRPPRRSPPAAHAGTGVGGAMSRLLGLSAPPSAQGIMASVTHAAKGLANSLPAMPASSPSDAPAGLGNVDNSCFQNSVLQGLSALESIPAYLEGAGVLDKMHPGHAVTAVALRTFVAALRGKCNNGKTLWTPIRLKSLDTWQQQDAQEYFTKLLDKVEREMARAARASIPVRGLEWDAIASSETAWTTAGSSDGSDGSDGSDDSGYQSSMVPAAAKSIAEAARMFKNPLEGLLAQRVVCTACRHTDGLDMIPFNFLTLNLPTGTPKCHLDECLDAYTRVEDIDGVECAKCTLLKARRLLGMLVDRNSGSGAGAGSSGVPLDEAHSRLQAITAALADEDFDWKTVHGRCKIAPRNRVASTKTKHTVIARPPQSLVLHVNRSVFDETTGTMYKNTASLGYEPYLHLGRWCIGSAAGAAALDDEQPQERWTVDPHAAMRSDETGIPLNPTYRLRAVITHFGRHENGHYVCYKQKPEKERNEEGEEEEKDPKNRWWRISDESVMAITEQDMPVRTEAGAFMLFYDCVAMTELGQSPAPQIIKTLATAPAGAVTPLTPPRDSPSPPPALAREEDADRPVASEMIYPLTPESSATMDDGPEMPEDAQELPESAQPRDGDVECVPGAQRMEENRDSPALSMDGEQSADVREASGDLGEGLSLMTD